MYIQCSKADICTLYPDIDCHFEYQHDILCSRSLFNDDVYTDIQLSQVLSLMLPKTLVATIQTNVLTVAILSVCFEMFETNEQRKMDKTPAELGNFLDS